ncbi:ArnT family glycosyltransferase [Crocosphaera watsonii]|uniref:4-amino-4-deoxy-L-arabinose transferase and related glycosyltransferases of PMT family n=3 Tax=Crocosphaera watsonii TaxID=263511 RepID=T2JT38_CROWT|nr:glycosyltransferase family 39 protein [Crocosphaera watsonii]EHJ09771.1 Glycosyl transferase, family 39 [Crocosphaera watsonii WH 0003]CCQ57721.1 4-amino-4-deoxy-L-arabinose transferase and related glycosyltransferases of PMT family [Crocosphaera watsonii WH 0005]CCQ67762.1 4-amino-4-deoxy-L-arabinose transferase and related glycosyltransferases of PMT family [Crocosphaera watsonii WH 0402]
MNKVTVEDKDNKIVTAWKKDTKNLWLFSGLWLFFISCIAFLVNLGSIGLMDKTEPMFVEAARQMVITGDWVTPYWNGETRFDKPPLTYWLVGLSFKLFGLNEWGARIPSALAAIAVVILGFYTLKKFGFSRAYETNQTPTKLWFSALIGAGIIALNPFWIAWGRTGVSDMFLSSGIALACLSFFLGYGYSETSSKSYYGLPVGQWWYIAYWVFMALGVLAKGPVALVLPGLTVIVFLLYVGRFIEVVKETPWLLGIGSFSLVAVPWFVLVTLEHGQEYINTFFGLHNVQRFTSVVSRHPGGWYYYFPVIMVGLLPWSIYLPLAIARLRVWQRRQWINSPRKTHLGIFCLAWFFVVLVFFSSSVTKLAGYVLPLMPAAAIIIALFWSEQVETKSEEASGIWSFLFLLSGIANVGVLIGLGVASFFAYQLIGEDAMMPQFKELLQGSNSAIKGGIIWSSAALSCLLFLLVRNYRSWLWTANLLGFLAFFSWVGLPVAQIVDNQRQLPLRELSTIVKTERQADERLAFLGFMRPTLVFYTQEVVDSVTEADIDNGPALDYFQQTGNSDTVLIISEQKYLNKLGLDKSDYTLIQQEGVYKLIRVSKQIVVARYKNR